MNSAHDMDMTSSDYVYISYSLSTSAGFFEPWGPTEGLDETAIKNLQKPYARLKQLVANDFQQIDSLKVSVLLDKIARRNEQLPWWKSDTLSQIGYDVSNSAVYLYRSVWLYLTILAELVAENGDIRDGSQYFQRSKNRTIQGDFGQLRLDHNADAVNTYFLYQLKPDELKFTRFLIVRTFLPEGQEVYVDDVGNWGTSDGKEPKNEPSCGFKGEKCLGDTDIAIMVYVCFVFLVAAFALLWVILNRKLKWKKAIVKQSWKIELQDLNFLNTRMGGLNSSLVIPIEDFAKSENSKNMSISKGQGQRHSLSSSVAMSQTAERDQVFTDLCSYKGTVYAYRQIKKTHNTWKLSPEDINQLTYLKEVTHENINPFFGACIVPPIIYLITKYCPKGSLQDVLENEDFQLDWAFKCSFIFDLASGLAFIHDSFLQSHGYLRSSYCLIDNRWVLKIACFGLNRIRRTEIIHTEMEEYSFFKEKFWTAPELLRLGSECPISGTQKGDIYSFGIILQEILFREMPFFLSNFAPREIIGLVKVGNPPYRPQYHELEDEGANEAILDLMEECWQEEPEDRPNIKQIYIQLVKINKGRRANILDNMIEKLEKYTSNLEEIVSKRTVELSSEKAKTDSLLYRMLPPAVAEKLKYGDSVHPEMYDCVTIYFSNIVNFAEMAAKSTAVEVVDLLNDLYTVFDDVIAQHDVYKVETIGDAYMVVSGCPVKNGDRHVVEIAEMSLAIRRTVDQFEIRHMPDTPLTIRIGIHSGPCATGVVGLTMPRYCLFGDTVNMASRMESNGEAMKIHVSQESQSLLYRCEKYLLSYRGEVNIKGKGKCQTFWLDENIVRRKTMASKMRQSLFTPDPSLLNPLM